jgi:hypothetical protein
MEEMFPKTVPKSFPSCHHVLVVIISKTYKVFESTVEEKVRSSFFNEPCFNPFLFGYEFVRRGQ